MYVYIYIHVYTYIYTCIYIYIYIYIHTHTRTVKNLSDSKKCKKSRHIAEFREIFGEDG